MSEFMGAVCLNFIDTELEVASSALKFAPILNMEGSTSITKIYETEKNNFTYENCINKTDGLTCYKADLKAEPNNRYFKAKHPDKGQIRAFQICLHESGEKPIMPRSIKDEDNNNMIVYLEGNLRRQGVIKNEDFFNTFKETGDLFKAAAHSEPVSTQANISVFDEDMGCIYFLNMGTKPLFFFKLTGSILGWSTHFNWFKWACETLERKINSFTQIDSHSLVIIDYDTMNWEHKPVRVRLDNERRELLFAEGKNKNSEKKSNRTETPKIHESLDAKVKYRCLTVQEISDPNGNTCMFCGQKIKPGVRVYRNSHTKENLHYECSHEHAELLPILQGRIIT